MAVVAKLRYLRIPSRKVRLVADLIRGKTAEEAQNILNFTIKKATIPMSKLLKEGIANAKNNFRLEESNLFIKTILVDEGPKYKRWRARARGSASEIQKKTSHITLILDEIKKSPKKVKKTKKTEEIEKVISGSVLEVGKEPKIEKAKFKPVIETAKPKIEEGKRRIFQRKVF